MLWSVRIKAGRGVCVQLIGDTSSRTVVSLSPHRVRMLPIVTHRLCYPRSLGLSSYLITYITVQLNSCAFVYLYKYVIAQLRSHIVKLMFCYLNVLMFC